MCGLSLLLVLFLAPTGFLWLLRFSALLKSHNFHIPVRPGMVENEPLCGRATSIFFIFLTFFYFNRVCNILDNKTRRPSRHPAPLTKLGLFCSSFGDLRSATTFLREGGEGKAFFIILKIVNFEFCTRFPLGAT